MEEEIQAIQAISTELLTNEPIKMVQKGNPNGVQDTIHRLHEIGLAEIGEWTPMQPTQNEGEVISILSRKISM